MAPGDRTVRHGGREHGGRLARDNPTRLRDPIRHAPLPIVLASASPRRADILTMLGLAFEVAPADVEERRLPDEAPQAYAERLAREKALAVSPSRPGALAVAGDTIVVLEDRVLEKPRDPAEAAAMLVALSGRSHDVVSALAIARGGRIASRVAVARVDFRSLDKDLIAHYVATREPMDKAGAYGIQGCGSMLVERIEGDYYTVVGLSVNALAELLPRLGLSYRPGVGVVRADAAEARSGASMPRSAP